MSPQALGASKVVQTVYKRQPGMRCSGKERLLPLTRKHLSSRLAVPVRVDTGQPHKMKPVVPAHGESIHCGLPQGASPALGCRLLRLQAAQ